MRKVSWPLIGAIGSLILGAVSPASADGTFFQFDLASDTSDVVLAGTRGVLSFGANYSDYEGGWSANAYLSRDFAVDGIGTVKVGPILGANATRDGLVLGAKLIAERYQPTEFGFLFVSGQYSTIENDWFALAQVGNGEGLSVDLTAGGSETYSERSIALNYRLGDGPVGLRTGYRFEAKEVFVGLSVNTY